MTKSCCFIFVLILPNDFPEITNFGRELHINRSGVNGLGFLCGNYDQITKPKPCHPTFVCV